MRRKPAEPACWLEKAGLRSKSCFVKKMTFWYKDMEKVGWVRREMSLLASSWLRGEAKKEMQRRSCLR